MTAIDFILFGLIMLSWTALWEQSGRLKRLEKAVLELNPGLNWRL